MFIFINIKAWVHQINVIVFIFFWINSTAQITLNYPLNDENIEIQKIPVAQPDGYYPRKTKTTSKPLTANSFPNNAVCPLTSSLILPSTGSG